MPEGHTIHRQAREQRADLVGHAVRTGVVQERFAAAAARLDGQVLTDVDAYGKHLFQTWEDGSVVHVHLGVYGKWRRQPVPPEPMVGAVRFRLVGPTHAWDLAGATVCAVVTPDEHERILAKLGPDPLRSPDGAAFLAKVARSTVPIGALRRRPPACARAAGPRRGWAGGRAGPVGRAAAPGAAGQSASPSRRAQRASAGGVLALRMDAMGFARRPGFGVYVYHRDLCRVCGTAIRTTELAARRIGWCPHCQPRRPRRDHPPPVAPPPGAPSAG